MFPILALACLFGVFYMTYYVWYRVFSYQGLPKTLSFADSDGTFISRGKSSLKSVLNMDSLFWAGHKDHSKQGRPYILPDVFTGHQVILPKDQIAWLTKQPATILNQRKSTNEFLMADHIFMKCISTDDAGWIFVSNLITALTKDLNNRTEEIIDEIQTALDELWGDDDDWREVNLIESLMEVMGRVVSRVYVGQELCRDKEYVKATTNFHKFVLFTGMLIQLTPKPFRPMVGSILAKYDWKQFDRQAERVTPIMKQRAEKYGANAEFEKNLDGPKDMLSRLMQEAYRRNEDPCLPQSHTMKTLCLMNWAAISTQTAIMENALIDVAHSSESLEIQEQLRDEVIANAKDQSDLTRWSRANVTKMLKIDSVLTESARLWSFSHGVIKLVVAKEGVKLPSGEHIPQGVKVGVAAYGVHHDKDVYSGDASTFDPFRFSNDKSTDKSGEPRFTATNGNYLTFSHGRYACVGRFFSDHILKLLLAQLVLRYDIKPNTAPRPQNMWISYACIPPVQYKLSIKRRELATA